MIAYLDVARALLGRLKFFRITQIPREENGKADALSKLASTMTNIWPKTIPVAHLARSSISDHDQLFVGEIEVRESNWMTPNRDHLEKNILPEDFTYARRVRYRASRYTIIRG